MLEDRIRRLERTNRILMGLLGACVVAALIAAQSPRAHGPSTATSFRLVDDRGNLIGSWGVEPETKRPTFAMLEPTSGSRFGIAFGSGWHPSVVLVDGATGHALTLMPSGFTIKQSDEDRQSLHASLQESALTLATRGGSSTLVAPQMLLLGSDKRRMMLSPLGSTIFDEHEAAVARWP